MVNLPKPFDGVNCCQATIIGCVWMLWEGRHDMVWNWTLDSRHTLWSEKDISGGLTGVNHCVIHSFIHSFILFFFWGGDPFAVHSDIHIIVV